MAEYARDAAATAAVFGFFASAWFGWAQEQPPRAWRPRLIAGAVVALVVMVAGGALTWLQWSDGTALDPGTSRAFGVVVGIEIAVAGLGAVALTRLRRAALVPAWIALVVGLHLFPLGPLLQYPLLAVVAALVTAVAIAAVPLARATALSVSAVTGVATGVTLLAAALISLVSAAARFFQG
jgi:hypothetical protein